MRIVEVTIPPYVFAESKREIILDRERRENEYRLTKAALDGYEIRNARKSLRNRGIRERAEYLV